MSKTDCNIELSESAQEKIAISVSAMNVINDLTVMVAIQFLVAENKMTILDGEQYE